MSTSTLVLYKNCRITPNKLFVVDDINDYLQTLSLYLVGTDFQYVRQGLKTLIKVNMSQDVLEGNLSNTYNYCTIQNKNGKMYYYFIVNAIQIAASTIQFELVLDSINTFKPVTDFTIEDKTLIKRQHKNRFKRNTDFVFEGGDASSKSGMFSFDVLDELSMTNIELSGLFKVDQYGKILERYIFNKIEIVRNLLNILEVKIYRGSTLLLTIPWSSLTYTYLLSITQATYNTLNGASISFLKEYIFSFYRNIDLQSEGVTPVLYGSNKTQILDDNQNWYLIYKGNNPVRAYVCADNGFDVEIGQSTSISATDLTIGTYYYILAELNGEKDVELTFDNGNKLTAYLYRPTSGFTTETCILKYWRDGSNIKIRGMYYPQAFLFPYYWQNDGQIFTINSFTITKSSGNVVVKTLNTDTHEIATIKQGATSSITITSTTSSVKPFQDVDLTSSQLIKVLKLPYKPFDNIASFKYDNTEKMIYLDNLATPFDKQLTIEGYNPLSPIIVDSSQYGQNITKNKIYESKLYHSDYYQPKFVYDSYSFIFALERVNIEKTALTNSSNFNFTFSVTNTINSKMMFTFSSYIDDGLALEDYSNILYVARNNEVTILDSSYINYLRTGYNYDVKTKERQEAGQWIGTGLSMVGAIVSFASSGVTGPLGVSAGITLATTSMTSLVNAVNTTAQAEATQNQKLNQYKNQRASVFGADDVDLMCRYTNNKAKLMIYECSDRMKNILYDLFYYTGYVSGERGVPNYTSRKWFNFVSCDLEINMNTSKNITNEIMNDIKAKYSLGVTFLHKIQVNGVNTWDFAQQYENWETNLN